MKRYKLKELNTGFEVEKLKPIFNKKQKSVIIIVSVLVAVFLFVFLLSKFGLFSFEAVSVRISDGIFGSGKNFPVQVESENLDTIKVFDSGFLLLTDRCVTVYSEDGNEKYTYNHTYSNPGVVVNGDRAVVFDRDGKGFVLLTDEKDVYSGEADGNILTAFFSENGDYALSCKGKKCTSEFTVYSSNHKIKFKWECAYENITSIALSDNGNLAGVALLGSENGEYYSGIQYFGYSYSEPLNSAVIKGVAPFEIAFTNNNTLTLFTDNGIYKLSQNSSDVEIIKEYYNTEFNSFSRLPSGAYILSLAKYGSTNLFNISLFSANGKLKKELSLDKEVISVSASEKYIFVLAEKEIMVYNHSCREVGHIDTEGKIYGIYPTDRFVFVNSLNSLRRTFSYGKSTLEIS